MDILETGGAPIKAWTHGVDVDETSAAQLRNVARMPFIFRHVAVMPDVHAGRGATIGSVIPTLGAVIPAAVGVDIGCGMVAQRTTLRAEQLPDDLKAIRSTLERTVPVGFNDYRDAPAEATVVWATLAAGLEPILAKHPKVATRRRLNQLGTLGGGNHFIELCIDEEGAVWVMLHSGSRGIGNRIGTYFIEKAKTEMAALGVDLPDRDLAYLREGETSFDDYVEAVGWAQTYARANRATMLERVLKAQAHEKIGLPAFVPTETAVNCHHNYIAREEHFGTNVYVTRKGAVSARSGELGIIPGSMGAKSFIVRGKGNRESFTSCSHGAGRKMSRTQARAELDISALVDGTAGIECRKDKGVLDEAPAAYKDIDAVMAAQSDLVEIVHTLRQVVCIKG